jgi:type 1 glutamine amidotransferase
VAWVRLHRGGRVFYTSLGHPDDFRQPSFLRLLVNAIFWTTRRE